jgi:uncharacterized membrane-anchored protein
MNHSRLDKVARVGAAFWLLKVLTTTVGDVSGDALSQALHLGYAPSLLVAALLSAALLLAQWRSRRWRPVLYWAVMLAASAFGAELSDTLARALHWGSAATAGALAAALLATCTAWRMHSGGPRVDTVRAPGDEGFYWLAVLLADSLGSVLGDLLGDSFGLGLLGSSAAFGVVLLLLLALRNATRANRGALFWTAFVFSRIPL